MLLTCIFRGPCSFYHGRDGRLEILFEKSSPGSTTTNTYGTKAIDKRIIWSPINLAAQKSRDECVLSRRANSLLIQARALDQAFPMARTFGGGRHTWKLKAKAGPHDGRVVEVTDGVM